ncbi:diaminopimelate decarboxylase family protein [Paraburkholderia caballeronis]|uniref:diaminopimelate decarboxylase family protein n=1 Tax=Paraburkholderia caballeronis TaxID=416943 RepID=UPI0010E81A08|nr:alanine racemase [Paraburkholderia caballeronis]TDV15668.1 diaminopimelate decarboxylase [Paraburkholderia caballeronis]TDV17923.1 diaminopimelate decarboxylase [Paraburkholderia caballeronis]TDV26463.1 diaminopimelate decarboxylase [Paraburkholderia caballeronis]
MAANGMAAQTQDTDNPGGLSVQFGKYIGIGADGNLWVDGCDVQALAQEHGAPLYIVSENELRHRYRAFRDGFLAHYPHVEILFANKSNNGLAIRHVLNQEGAGGDCFGVNEMYIALLAGTDPRKLVLNGSNKQDEELEMAIANGICVNIDAMDELDRVDAISQRLGRKVAIGIRLKLDLLPLAGRTGVAMHGPGTLKEQSDSTKWGMTREQTVEIVRRAQRMPNVELKETHFHLSRMSNDPENFAIMAREMIVWSGYLRDETGWTPPCIDIGGGWTFGKWYGTGPRAQIDDDRAPTPDVYGRQVGAAIREEAARLGLPLPMLRIEPGRAISGPSGIAIGRVGAIKQGAKKKWVNLDLSTNHLSWASALDWYYHAVAVRGTAREASELVDLVGPLCNSDEVGAHRLMPPLARGDFVAFLDAGGYTESSAARYNAQLLPATVLVADGVAEVITVREQWRDVAGRFKVPPRLLAASFGGARG